jgi:Txe/YoeB family toxin of Txe-Axe toxin-antitoxin module
MKVVFTESAWRDYLWFQEQSRQLLKQIDGTFTTFPF